MDIIIFILVLGLIILIHEFGHFYFARKAGILCHEFSLGMGPAIYQKRKGEIVYSIRAIPLGGYVSMAGEDMGNMIYKDQRIGVRLNDDNIITDIILNDDLKYDFIGQVQEFDLIGTDLAPLFIELKVDGEITRYEVLRNGRYLLSPKKEMWIAPSERSYEHKTLWQRFLVVFAGPASNFILAFLLLFILAFFIGKPSMANKIGKVDKNFNTTLKSGDVVSKVNGNEVSDWKEMIQTIYSNQGEFVYFTINDEEVKVDLQIVVQGLGFSNKLGESELVVGQVFGRKKDILPGDKILGIFYSDSEGLKDVQYARPTSWNTLLKEFEGNENKANVYLEVLRDEKVIEISYGNVLGSTLLELGSPYVGYATGFAQSRQFNILYPFYYPFQKIGSSVSEMFTTLKLLFGPKTGVGIGDLSGPVGIFSMVRNARKNGIQAFVEFIAFLSINIGLLNLLPIPALDGGRLVFIGYEAITKRKVNKKVENGLIMATFILLFGLMIYVTFNDVFRLF